MKDKILARLEHAVMAVLLSAGLVMPLCGAMEETMVSPFLIGVICACVLLFELASLHRITAWAAFFLFIAGVLLWILTGNGARILSDCGIAAGLRIRGLRTALPLIARPFSILTAVLTTLLCCFSVLRKATCIPSLMLLTAVILIVWLADATEMIPWLLPALAAVLTMMMTSRHETVQPLRILPWAAGLTAAAFLLTGSGPTDNALKKKADELRQAVLDRLFFTEARDIFSLYSAGFSPQGIEQLGGKPDPSDSPVMQVSSPKTVYLRGTVYNRYTGHGWQNTTGGRRYLWQSRVMAETRAALFDETLPPPSVLNTLSEPQRVSVRMLSGSASTLFVPQRVRELNPGGENVPYFSNSSEIFITRNLQEGDTWEVSAPLYFCTDPGIGALTDLCAAAGDPRWETVRNTYTELPSHLEKPVWDLAERITAAAGSPYEKAMAVQNYLIRSCAYTLDVPEHPVNIDFVTSFLLDTKKGYCTYFASAMTVLCRMAGLPSRYVEGYLAEPDESGSVLVTGMNAHAWTEVYFYGFGWLTFDATPGQHRSGRQSQPPPPQATPTPEPPDPGIPDAPVSPEPTPSPEGGQDAPQEDPPPESPGDPEPEPEAPDTEGKSFPWWLLILLTAAAAGIRFRTTSPAFRSKRADSEEKRFDIWTEDVRSLLRAARLERRNGETVIAFAGRADAEGVFSESLMPAAACLSRIRYSREEPEEADTGLMRDTSQLIRSELSRDAKMRYFIHRLLSKKGFKRIIKTKVSK